MCKIPRWWRDATKDEWGGKSEQWAECLVEDVYWWPHRHGERGHWERAGSLHSLVRAPKFDPTGIGGFQVAFKLGGNLKIALPFNFPHSINTPLSDLQVRINLHPTWVPRAKEWVKRREWRGQGAISKSSTSSYRPVFDLIDYSAFHSNPCPSHQLIRWFTMRDTRSPFAAHVMHFLFLLCTWSSHPNDI